MRLAAIIFSCRPLKMERTDAELTSSWFRNVPWDAPRDCREVPGLPMPSSTLHAHKTWNEKTWNEKTWNEKTWNELKGSPLVKWQLAKGKANETLYNHPGCGVRCFQLFRICAKR
jgi:hypothetical protein